MLTIEDRLEREARTYAKSPKPYKCRQPREVVNAKTIETKRATIARLARNEALAAEVGRTGESIPKVAAEAGVFAGTLWNTCKRLGIQNRLARVRRFGFDIDQIRTLAREGKTSDRVAVIVGATSGTALCNWLAHRGTSITKLRAE